MEDIILIESLNGLTKDDLFRILSKFNIKMAKSTVKDKLIEKVLECYNVNSLEFLNIFSQDTIIYLSKLNSKENKISEEQFTEFEEFLIPLQSFGLISKLIKKKGDNHYLISTWLINCIKEIYSNENNQLLIQKNQEIEMLLLGMIRYYGVISENNLFSLINEIFSQISLEEINNFIEKRWLLNIFIAKIADESTGELFFISDFVAEPVDIIQETWKHSNLEYKKLSIEDYKKYWSYLYVDKSPEITNLIALLVQHKLEGTVIGFEISNILADIRNNVSVDEIVTSLNQRITFNSLESGREFTNVITQLSNILPLWSLKGHSRKELSLEVKAPSLTRTVEKIGRNEPCPCGSNKKYKKCCGK